MLNCNKITTSLLFFLLLFKSSLGRIYALDSNYYVSPNGSDTNPGTLSQPFQTITHARDFLRTAKNNITGNITVYLMRGTYVLNEAIFFGQQDSGNPNQSITYTSYNNDTVMLSGGQKYSNWQVDGSRWKTFIGPNLNFRDLWVNGQRAIRAQEGTPQNPFAKNPQWETYSWSTPEGETRNTVSGLRIDSSLASRLIQAGDVDQIELKHRWEWLSYLCRISNIQEGNLLRYISSRDGGGCEGLGTSISGVTPRGQGYPIYIENSLALLDTPGEWYYQKSTGWLFYQPLAGQDFNNTYAIVPHLQSLLVFGDNNSAASYLKFENLNFSYGTWKDLDHTLATTGVSLDQDNRNYRNINPDGLIYFGSANHIQISNSRIIHSGTDGITIGGNSSDLIINGNYLEDISASGINLAIHSGGLSHAPGVINNINVTNNAIFDSSRDYWSGAGISCGDIQNSNLNHNRIQKTASNGIVCEITTGDNVYINSNYVDDYRQILVDNGGIYVTSIGKVAPRINRNYVVGPQDNEPSQAIYSDEGANDGEINENVLYDKTGVIIHLGCRNKVSGNYIRHFDPNNTSTIIQAGRVHEEGSSTTMYGCDNNYNPTWGNGTNDIGTNYLVSNFDNPTAQEIINQAGVENQYKYLYGLKPDSWINSANDFFNIDLNHDGQINLTDFLLWKENYIQSKSNIDSFLNWKLAYLQ